LGQMFPGSKPAGSDWMKAGISTAVISTTVRHALRREPPGFAAGFLIASAAMEFNLAAEFLIVIVILLLIALRWEDYD